MTKQGFKKITLRVLAVILFIIILQLIRSWSNPLLNAIFTIKEMEKGGTATITKITLYQNGNEAKTVLGDNQTVLERIENLKLRNHLFNYSKERTQNYIAIEYHTTDKNGQSRLSDTFYIFDNGFYCDAIAEPFPVWKRDADLYSVVKEMLE